MEFLRCHEATGIAAVSFDGTTWVRLRRPTIRQWADWTLQLERLQERIHQAWGSSTADPAITVEQVQLAGPTTALNWEMIRTLAAVEWPVELGDDDPRALLLADLSLAKKLLGFWWECPLAPWPRTGASDDTPDEVADAPRAGRARDDGKEKRKITTGLPSALGALSMIYQALGVVGLGSGPTPKMIDDHEVWQIAVMLGRDTDRAELSEHGGMVKMRSDGQEAGRVFERDPDQPRFFGLGANPKAAWEWLQRKRRRMAERARDVVAGRRPRQRRTWNK